MSAGGGPKETGGLFGTSDTSTGTTDAAPTRVKLDDYLFPDATTLWGRVDFIGLIRDLSQSMMLAVLTFGVGIIAASNRAILSVYESIIGFIQGISPAIITAPTLSVPSATAISAAELDIFGVVALPVSVVIALSSFLVVAIVLYVFWGWRG